ncbi:hypothetical protein [Microbacterium sp.]|uniref:hypothetical protein n=1 Tax=Microbacterium sp. TaxID=51671 RepID=UPI0028126FCB|nr:hypothetical protein [Microbacterium sp.]
MASRLLRSALALGALTLLIAGCTSAPGDSPAPTSSAGADAGQPGDGRDEEPEPGDVEAAWLDDGRGFAVVTWGSSGCVPHAAETVADGQTVTVTLQDRPADAVCTMDFAPRASFAALPQGVDPTRDVRVRVRYGDVSGDAELEALPAAPDGDSGVLTGKASAGWFDDQGLVLLTWGSGSCRPVVEEVVQSAAGATVTFAPFDGVCTADMAPRTTVIVLPSEPEDDAPFTLTVRDGDAQTEVPVR